MKNIWSKIKKSPLLSALKPVWRVIRRYSRHLYRCRMVDSALRNCNRNEKHIFYVGVCESSNMGDLAQTYCTRMWFKKNYPEYKVVECLTSVIMDEKTHTLEKMREICGKDDMIFFQSGYNTHDLGGNEDLMHQKVIRFFPDNVTVVLPQTVYFQTEERKQLCSSVLNAHKKLLFFARDPISYELAKEMFPNLHVKLYPDIVTMLIGKKDYSEAREGIYLCRRHDIEQFYQEEDYIRFANILKQLEKVDVSDTIIKETNREIYRNLDQYVENIVKRFAGYKVVVTDKFHGLVFSLAANTPVIVLKTKDHKVTSGYEWFSKIYPDRVFYADTQDDIMEIAKNILENPRYTLLDDYFDKEYYQKLLEIIETWRKVL